MEKLDKWRSKAAAYARVGFTALWLLNTYLLARDVIRLNDLTNHGTRPVTYQAADYDRKVQESRNDVSTDLTVQSLFLFGAVGLFITGRKQTTKVTAVSQLPDSEEFVPNHNYHVVRHNSNTTLFDNDIGSVDYTGQTSNSLPERIHLVTALADTATSAYPFFYSPPKVETG